MGEILFFFDGLCMYMVKGYKDCNGDGWLERKSFGFMFNCEDWGIMCLMVLLKGIYVFDDYKSGDVICIFRFKDGKC